MAHAARCSTIYYTKFNGGKPRDLYILCFLWVGSGAAVLLFCSDA